MKEPTLGEAPHFVDPAFPPNQDSLFNLNNTELSALMLPHWKSLAWVRASELFYPQTPTLYSNIDPLDIQGSQILENNYFISALISIATNPDRVRKICEEVKGDLPGKYVIHGYFSGKRVNIEIDDYIPTDIKKGIPGFVKSSQKALWPIFIEKAWAKINSSYESIGSGSLSEALQFLTGSPCCSTFNHLDIDFDTLWNHIIGALNSNHFVCATQEKNPNAVSSFSYPVVSAKEYTISGKQYKLLIVLDPFETKKWDGDWSRNSKTWTEEAKRVIGSKNQNASNKFMISIEDFTKFYQSTTICYVYENYLFDSLECKQKPTEFSLISLKIPSQTYGYLTISQLPKRVMSQKYVNYEVSEVAAMLGKITETGVSYIKGGTGKTENYSIELLNTDESGEYIVFVEINWGFEGIDSFVINSVTDKKITLSRVDQRKDNLSILESMMKSCAELKTKAKTYAENNEPLIKRYASINDSQAGYGYLYYKNDSADSVLYETITFKELRSLKILSGMKGRKIKIELPPNQSHLILLKKAGKGAGYSLDKSTKIKFSKEKLLVLFNRSGKEKKIAEGDVWFKTLSHDFGYIWSCQNRSKTTLFAGKFKFTLQNTEIEENKGKNDFEIELKPGENIIKFIWTIDMEQGSGYKYDYIPFFNDLNIPSKEIIISEMLKLSKVNQIKYGNEGLMPIQYYTMYKNGNYYWYFINISDKKFTIRLEFTPKNLQIAEPIDQNLKPNDWEIILSAKENVVKIMKAIDYKQPVGYQVIIKLTQN